MSRWFLMAVLILLLVSGCSSQIPSQHDATPTGPPILVLPGTNLDGFTFGPPRFDFAPVLIQPGDLPTWYQLDPLTETLPLDIRHLESDDFASRLTQPFRGLGDAAGFATVVLYPDTQVAEAHYFQLLNTLEMPLHAVENLGIRAGQTTQPVNGVSQITLTFYRCGVLGIVHGTGNIADPEALMRYSRAIDQRLLKSDLCMP